jgi:putative transposase
MPQAQDSTPDVLEQEDFVQEVMQRVRAVARAVFEQAMEEELTTFLQALPYQRNPQRKGRRNGYYTRGLLTSFGPLPHLKVPRSREGPFHSQLYSRYRRRQKRVDQAISEMFIKGVSTRKVGEVTGLLMEEKPRAATVSRVFQSLREECEAWRRRPLESHYRYIYLDGVYFSVGYEDSFVKEPVLAALGVNLKGEKELLGYGPGDKESLEAWKGFLGELKERGLKEAQLFITDGSQAVIGAVEELFPTARRQRCVVHKLRNVDSKVPCPLQEEVREAAKHIFYQGDKEQARQEAEAFCLKWGEVIPEGVACLQRDLEDCLSFYDFPKEHWRYIRSNNTLERLFEEVKRRTRLMGAFRNEKSCILLFYAVTRAIRWQRMPVPEAILHKS